MRLGQRQIAWLREHFAGRSRELAWLATAFGDGARAQVAYLFAPAGTGKTALLQMHAARERRRVTWIDGRVIEATPDGLRRAIGSLRGRRLVIVDAYDHLPACDAWVRGRLVPKLPRGVLLILATRTPPGTEWRALPGWGSLVRELPLEPLDAREASALLRRRGVPARAHASIMQFARGHALALVLVAESGAARTRDAFHIADAPDVFRGLIDRFLDGVPGPSHRLAIEACVVARATTEPLLAAMTGSEDAAALFAWLGTLGFVETSPAGLVPHDLVRDVVFEELRWRAPERLALLIARAHDYAFARIARDPSLAPVVVEDELFLHRHDPAIANFYGDSLAELGFSLEPADRDDLATVVALVGQHEGARAASIAERWLRTQSDGLTVVRDIQHTLVGFNLRLALERADAGDLAADPGARAAMRYLRRHAPLRPGDRVVMNRFWLERSVYQAPSIMHAASPRALTRHLLATPRVAFSFLCFAEPTYWEATLRRVHISRLPEVDFDVGGRRVSVFGHDWRVEPPLVWLDRMRRDGGAAGPVTPVAEVDELDRDQFVAAVRECLRRLHEPERLRESPLVRAQLVLDDECGADPSARVPALIAIVRGAVAALGASPQTERWRRALDRTYLDPAPTQLRAAEAIGSSFSTYRRHLAAGLASVGETLWQREVAARSESANVAPTRRHPSRRGNAQSRQSRRDVAVGGGR